MSSFEENKKRKLEKEIESESEKEKRIKLEKEIEIKDKIKRLENLKKSSKFWENMCLSFRSWKISDPGEVHKEDRKNCLLVSSYDFTSRRYYFFLSNILQNNEDDGEGKPVLELWVQAVHAATLQ